LGFRKEFKVWKTERNSGKNPGRILELVGTLWPFVNPSFPGPPGVQRALGNWETWKGKYILGGTRGHEFNILGTPGGTTSQTWVRNPIFRKRISFNFSQSTPFLNLLERLGGNFPLICPFLHTLQRGVYHTGVAFL